MCPLANVLNVRLFLFPKYERYKFIVNKNRKILLN